MIGADFWQWNRTAAIWPRGTASPPGPRPQSYLGPVAATSTEAGLSLVEALVSRCEGETIYWDIPDANTAAVEWARQQGFILQRPLIRMYLGENPAPSDARKQFAIAGPEVG